MTGWRAAVLFVAAALAVLAGSARAACPGDEMHYRLYRSSAAIHVATFDSVERTDGGSPAEYNAKTAKSLATCSKANRAFA